jgi:4Fe-4S single cluster domain of Ferredoxin I
VKKAHPLNVPGDFYVEDGCCVSCEMPFQAAPGHFQYDDRGHCFVCKQPSNDAELASMINAIDMSDVDCIRYAGSDPVTLRRIATLGQASVSDAVNAGHVAPRKTWWMFWRR